MNLKNIKKRIKVWLINYLLSGGDDFEANGVKCFVSFDESKNCFFAYMPDGTKIPYQVNMRLTDNLQEPLICSIDFICEFKNGQTRI